MLVSADSTASSLCIFNKSHPSSLWSHRVPTTMARTIYLIAVKKHRVTRRSHVSCTLASERFAKSARRRRSTLPFARLYSPNVFGFLREAIFRPAESAFRIRFFAFIISIRVGKTPCGLGIRAERLGSLPLIQIRRPYHNFQRRGFPADLPHLLFCFEIFVPRLGWHEVFFPFKLFFFKTIPQFACFRGWACRRFCNYNCV